MEYDGWFTGFTLGLQSYTNKIILNEVYCVEEYSFLKKEHYKSGMRTRQNFEASPSPSPNPHPCLKRIPSTSI